MKVLLMFFLIALSATLTFGQSGDVKKLNSDAEVPRITVAESKKGFDEGSVVFVDARNSDIYRQDHIKGALSIPSGSDNFGSLPKGKRIIVYCS